MTKEGAKYNSNEMEVGVIADILLDSSWDFFYDFERREFARESRAGYFFDLSNIFSGLGFCLGARIRFNQTNKPFVVKIEGKDLRKKV
jgi:hypothetical protein